jgi:hypothetical protein
VAQTGDSYGLCFLDFSESLPSRFHLSGKATSQELVPFEALDAIRIAVAVIGILISGFCRFGRLR